MKQFLSSLCLLGATSLMAQNSLDTFEACDANLDGSVSVADATSVVNHALYATSPGTQVVTAEQLNAVLQKIEGELAALRSHAGLPEPGGSSLSANTSFQITKKILHVGDTFTQEVSTSSDGSISYISTNPSVATVDASTGLVTAIANGETTILASVAASSTYPSSAASYTVLVENLNQHMGHEYVDLGVVVDGKKILFAKTNIGAEKPADYGDYYAWGEIETKDHYWWDNYKYAEWIEGEPAVYDEDGFLLVPPVQGHNRALNLGLDISGTQYDAARQNWGGSWRIPTKEELSQLREKCDWTITSMANSEGNPIAGYKVSNKENGRNFIFLPMAGFGVQQLTSEYGLYWSSTQDINNEFKSDALQFRHDYCFVYESWENCYGYSVRPVLTLEE